MKILVLLFALTTISLTNVRQGIPEIGYLNLYSGVPFVGTIGMSWTR